MSTSNDPIHVPDVSPTRGPLRLRMARTLGRDTLDGGWWPRSRELATELVELADHFPAALGHVTRVLVSPPDWDDRPRSVRVARGMVKVGSFPRDDTHLITLTTSNRTLLRVLVVPPGYSDDQGDEALLAAATHGNAHSATELLETVTEHPDIDRRDLWPADG